MLHFFEKKFVFDKKKGGPNVKRETIDITRANPSSNARVVLVLKGFDIKYTGKDHHLLRVFVRPELDSFGPFTSTVGVRVTLGLRDSSGNWDDQYEGHVALGIVVVDDPNVDVFEGEKAFPYTKGHGPRSDTDFLQLNNPSEEGIAFLRGFDIGFEKKDHHVLEICGGVDKQVVQINGAPQRFDAVKCRLGLRDSSGFWDDAYGGEIAYSTLQFPQGSYAVETGRISVSEKNQGPAEGTDSHFAQANTPRESFFVGLTGFQLGYRTKDHHVHRLTATVGLGSVSSDQRRSIAQVDFKGGIRDKSGNWDDQYEAGADYALLVVPPQRKPVALRGPGLRNWPQFRWPFARALP